MYTEIYRYSNLKNVIINHQAIYLGASSEIVGEVTAMPYSPKHPPQFKAQYYDNRVPKSFGYSQARQRFEARY